LGLFFDLSDNVFNVAFLTFISVERGGVDIHLHADEGFVDLGLGEQKVLRVTAEGVVDTAVESGHGHDVPRGHFVDFGHCGPEVLPQPSHLAGLHRAVAFA